MHQLITTTLATLILSALALNVQAQQTGQIIIPEKVKADIIKRHPKALDLQASHETHFKRHLLEISFKEEGSEEQILELFREDNRLFTRELLLDDLSEAPDTIKDVLQKNFAGYKLQKAEMIANPNGNGEEYEIYLLAGGVNWKVSVNEKGEIVEQQKN
jgi:hypothetical protein